MRKTLIILRREYVETVKTKAFLASIFMTPLLIAGIFLLSDRMEGIVSGPAPARRIAVANLAVQMDAELELSFERHNTAHADRKILPTFHDAADHDRTHAKLEHDVQSGAIDGYIVIAAEVVEGTGACQYYTRTPSDMALYHTLANIVNGAVRNTRFVQHDVSPELVARLQQGVSLEQIDASSMEKRRTKPMVAMMMPFFFLFLMFMGIFGLNQQMLTSVIEEKSSRVIEVLLSAVSPRQLMAGKILGLGAVGLTVVGVWGAGAYVAATAKGITGILSATSLFYFVTYYVLGFLLFSAIFAAIGSVCNTIKEAQSLVAPLTFLMVIPMMAWMPISQRPGGTLAVALSFVPPATPMVMVVRLAASPDVPLVQIVGSIALLVVSLAGALWAAAKIFRTGILMYGKPPAFRELFRWLRQG